MAASFDTALRFLRSNFDVQRESGGVADFGIALSAKRLEFIKQLLIPAATWLPTWPWVSTVEETDAAFATFAQKRVDAVQGTFGMMERAT